MGKKYYCRKNYHSNYIFPKYSKIYPFTNEDLIGCFNSYDFNNKRCLTVLGSSDQALDMYLRGASEITTFDINVLTKYFFYLKKAALLSNLTKEEYIDFFYPLPHIIRDKIKYYNTFSKIAKNLSGTNLTFWSKLFDTRINSLHNLFSNDVSEYNSLEKSIKYLSGDNYYILREKIKDMEIKFINSDVISLPDKLSSNYDYIYLSNIMSYSEYIYNASERCSLEEYKKLILQLIDKLNENGIIVVCYFYFKIPYIKDIFNEQEFYYNYFGDHDLTLQYTKRTTSK